MRKYVSAMMGLVLAAGVVAGCGGAKVDPAGTNKSEKMKVAWIYVGPVGDGGYSFMHDQGRLQVQKQLGDKVETTFLESVPEGADAERVLEDLVQKGNKLIYATSFGYMDAVVNVAKKHPEVTFMHASGYKSATNVGTYFGRNHEGFYLSGIAAGEQIKGSKNNTVGFVAAYPIPEVIRAINAFTLGAQTVNPTVKVKVVWTNTWFDPAKEKDAAKSLLDVGADLIAMYQDSPGPLQAAQEANKPSIGNDSDSRQYAPKSFLTAAIWNWGPYYVKTTQAVLDKTWKSEQYWGHMKDGIVDVAPLADFAKPDAKSKVEAAKKLLMSGTFEVFTGPIKDQSGKEKVAKDVKVTDEQQLAMDWFVQGIEGTIPKN